MTSHSDDQKDLVARARRSIEEVRKRSSEFWENRQQDDEQDSLAAEWAAALADGDDDTSSGSGNVTSLASRGASPAKILDPAEVDRLLAGLSGTEVDTTPSEPSLPGLDLILDRVSRTATRTLTSAMGQRVDVNVISSEGRDLDQLERSLPKLGLHGIVASPSLQGHAVVMADAKFVVASAAIPCGSQQMVKTPMRDFTEIEIRFGTRLLMPLIQDIQNEMSVLGIDDLFVSSLTPHFGEATSFLPSGLLRAYCFEVELWNAIATVWVVIPQSLLDAANLDLAEAGHLSDTAPSYPLGSPVDEAVDSVADVKRLYGIPPRTLAMVLRNELPQVAAIALSLLPPTLASGVLVDLPYELRPKLALALAQAESLPAYVYPLIADELLRQTSGVTPVDEQSGEPLGVGVKAIADLLKGADRATEEEVLAEVEEESAMLASKIRNCMFDFDDIASLSTDALQQLYDQVGVDVVSVALMGAGGKLRRQVLSALPSDVSEGIASDLNMAPPIRLSDVAEAQNIMLYWARKLAGRG